jgi:predicted ATPase
MVWEDVHWSDPTTRESLDLLVDRAATLRILVIVTFRPEFTPPWIGRPHVALLTLSRLPPRKRVEMITRVTGGKALPKEIADQIVDRTDGVPLFIEELTKSVVESGLVAEAEGQYIATRPAAPLAVPTTLHASLLARLDRLAPTREIAQIGAALGRSFSHELISTVAQMPQHHVDNALAQLVHAELIFQRGIAPDAEYTFKHALVQDAAYSTLLRGRRQQLHTLITATLEDRFPEIVAAQPALLAKHCAEAGLNEKAVNFWCTAGQHAVRRASNREAIGHFRQALSHNERQPDSAARSHTELTILSQLGPALVSVNGWAAPDVGVVFERAGNVARQLESSIDLSPPLAGLWLFHSSRGQLARADEISSDLFRIARELDDPDVLLQAYHTTWPTRRMRGLFADAHEHIERGIALYDEVRHEPHRYLYLGHDPAVCALGTDAAVQWILGYPERAARLEREAVALARRLQHVPSLAIALWFVGYSQIARDDITAVMATAIELRALCEEHGLPYQHAAALILLGWALARTGEVGEGTRQLVEGLGAWNQLGARAYVPHGICLLAESHLVGGRTAEGLECVAQALAMAADTGEYWSVARLHQLRALLLLQIHGCGRESAEAHLRTAIGTARAQGARGLELRAATSLARLWCEQGKRQEARDLLAPVYGWFTEGFDTLDLKEASALLDELHA